MKNYIKGRIILLVTVLVCLSFLTWVFSTKEKAIAQPPPCFFTNSGTYPLTIEGLYAGDVPCNLPQDCFYVHGTVNCQGGIVSCGQYSLWINAYEEVDGEWLNTGEICIFTSGAMDCGDDSNMSVCYPLPTGGAGWDINNGNNWQFFLMALKTPCSSFFNKNNIFWTVDPLTYNGETGWGGGQSGGY